MKNSNKTESERSTESQQEKVNDPFDPEKLRLSQDFAANLGIKKAIVTVPVRKPTKENWVRVHPDEKYRIQTGILELKEERELYLVSPELWTDLANEPTFAPLLLMTALTRQGVLFLWPVRFPDQNGKMNPWNQSALDAAKLAMSHWVRITANMSLGAYDVTQATADLSEPEWPDMIFRDILEIAFKEHWIDSLYHPVLKRLRGEI